MAILKEEAAQIQKVSAQVTARKSVPQLVVNKQYRLWNQDKQISSTRRVSLRIVCRAITFSAGSYLALISSATSFFLEGVSSKKYLVQLWWIPSGVSALGDRSTFMPALKEDAPARCHNLRKKNYENTKHDNEAHRANSSRYRSAAD
jgi:hypothetical protein